MITFKTRLISVFLRNYLRYPRQRAHNFVVTGYPKSGTTWVTHLVGGLAGLSSKQLDIELRLKGVALHTHGVNFAGRENLLYVVRDPRETICSAARASRENFPYPVFDDSGMVKDRFVEDALRAFPGALIPMKDHLQKAIGAGWTYVRFEDLKADPHGELERLSHVFAFGADAEKIDATISQYAFERQRKKNSDNGFYAQSSLSSWKELLSSDALSLIDEEVGQQARFFGYDLAPGSATKGDR